MRENCPHKIASQEVLMLIKAGEFLKVAAKIDIATDLLIFARQLFFKRKLLKNFLPEVSPIHWPHFEELQRSEDNDTRYHLGICFLLGIGVEQSDDRAYAYFQLVVKEGQVKAASALHELGWMFIQNRAGIQLSQTERDREACKYWRLSTEVRCERYEESLSWFLMKRYVMLSELCDYVVDLIKNPLPAISDESKISEALTCNTSHALPIIPVYREGRSLYCLFSILRNTKFIEHGIPQVHPAEDVKQSIIKLANTHSSTFFQQKVHTPENLESKKANAELATLETSDWDMLDESASSCSWDRMSDGPR